MNGQAWYPVSLFCIDFRNSLLFGDGLKVNVNRALSIKLYSNYGYKAVFANNVRIDHS